MTRRCLLLLTIGLALLLIAFLLFLFASREDDSLEANGEKREVLFPVDYNGDGVYDGRHIYSDGAVFGYIADRNGDGYDDYWLMYDGSEWGLAESFFYDSNHTGSPNVKGYYSAGVLQYVEYDFDEDGHFEYVEHYYLDLVSLSVWKDASGNEVKKIVHENGRPVSVLFDCDNDGLAETKRDLDWRGEPIPYLCAP